MTSTTLDFSKAKNRFSELFRRVAGSTRVYRIRHQRHKREVALLPAEMLDGLLAENAILRDKSLVSQIAQARRAQAAGRLVEYSPRDRMVRARAR